MPQNWLPGDIRDRIRDLCRVKNLKQSELAHAIGIDKSTLSRFMSGKTDKLSDSSLQKIAQHLNVSTDFLLGNTDISPSLATTSTAPCPHERQTARISSG